MVFKVNYIVDKGKGCLVNGIDSDGQSKTIVIKKSLISDLKVGDVLDVDIVMMSTGGVHYKVAQKAKKISYLNNTIS